jgi:voltage-gated potassium channel
VKNPTDNNKKSIHKKDKLQPWQRTLHTIIFEAETPAGKLFDIVLLIFILLSVSAILLESVVPIKEKYGNLLTIVEWFFTIAFTLEYIVRLLSVSNPLRYAKSFLGLVDFISIIPTYLSLFIPGSQALIIIRIVRLLRVFRIFKLVHFLQEAGVLANALKASRNKVIVFVLGVFCIVVIMGTVMYLIEGPVNGFTNIPTSMYWAVVTLTTVGYGDIAPQTSIGQFIASLIMILGYGIIAVPTGIVTTEIVQASRKPLLTEACPNCGQEGHDLDAKFCKFCGEKL